jgi:hypothetical protein
MSDGVVAAAGRRAGDDAPSLRVVVDALIDGLPVAWDRVDRVGRTAGERRMTRELGALMALVSPPPRTSRVDRWSAARGGVAIAGLGRAVAAAWAQLCHPVVAALDRLRALPAVHFAALAADLQRARSPREVAAALLVHLDHVVGSAAHVVTPGDRAWAVLVGQLPHLDAESGVASLLASADEPIRVDPRARLHALLPDADRTWLAVTGVSTLVRLAGPEGEVLAGLVVAGRADGRPHDRRQRAFIAAAARTSAVALAAMDRPRAQARTTTDADLAFECGTCGVVTAAPHRCPCGGTPQLAALPACVREIFRVERRIGQGGMGVVYLGRDLRLDRPVALKTMPTLSAGRVASLHAEARAMAAVEHANIAVLYGLEEWRGTPVLVAEYLPGGTLATRLATGPLPVSEAVAIGIVLADALATLHARGWLHRDIKPSNIGFCRAGQPKLLDFGLTHWPTETSDDEGLPLSGTPLYLSPELLDGMPPSAPDDVWALGVVVAEMIAGVHPFRAASLDDLTRRVRRGEGLDAARLGTRVPPTLTTLLAQVLHPSRAVRPSSARALAASLRMARASS